MSFVEIQEYKDGHVFTQIFTSLEGKEMHKLTEALIEKELLEFSLFLRKINGVNWKHINFLEKWNNLDDNYYEHLFPEWFRSTYLTYRGNGLTTDDNIAEFCGSISSPGEKPTTRELLEVLEFKKFIAHFLEKSEECRKRGPKFLEQKDDLHVGISELGNKIGFKGGSWCIFSKTHNDNSNDVENKEQMKLMLTKLLGNLFYPDIPSTAWKDIWRVSLKVFKNNVVTKLSNTYTSYFDDFKTYGFSEEHDEIWFYKRDTQVKNVFRMIGLFANHGKFYFRYKPEMLSMCGIRKDNMKGTVLCIYTSIPKPYLLKPERTDYVKEYLPNDPQVDRYQVRYSRTKVQQKNPHNPNETSDSTKKNIKQNL